MRFNGEPEILISAFTDRRFRTTVLMIHLLFYHRGFCTIPLKAISSLGIGNT